MKNKKQITFLTIFLIVFFPIKLFADHQSWHSWFSSDLDWYLEPNLEEVVFRLFERADLLFEDNISKQAAKKFIEKDFNKLSEYQMKYPGIRDECFEDIEMVNLKYYTSIEDCVYNKDRNLLSKLGLVLRTPRERYEQLFDRANQHNKESWEYRKQSDNIQRKLSRQYWKDLDRIIRDNNSALVYELENKLFLFFVERAKADKEKKETKEENQPTQSSGSGFFISEEGHIVTNFHVIDGCNIIYVNPSWDKNIKFGYVPVVVKDETNDLAILKVHKDLIGKKIKTIKFDKGDIKKGDEVLVIGYPFGDDFGNEAKITKGIISALQGIENDYSRIQIDAAIQPGNSGGPVLNQKGNLVGVAVATANIQAFIEDYGTIPQNMNFAVKSNILKMILEANEINFSFNDNNNLKTNSDIFQEADDSVVLIDCYY